VKTNQLEQLQYYLRKERSALEEYELIVIGSGAGMNVVDRARKASMKVALVENGPLGGTCLNRGCIPSKILIHPADVIREIEDAARVGVHAKIKDLDFNLVRKRMWDLALGDRQGMERSVQADSGTRILPPHRVLHRSEDPSGRGQTGHGAEDHDCCQRPDKGS
jgi:hypothetical protein